MMNDQCHIFDGAVNDSNLNLMTDINIQFHLACVEIKKLGLHSPGVAGGYFHHDYMQHLQY